MSTKNANQIITSAWEISKTTIQHVASQAAKKLSSNPKLTTWEFECRYRRYLARFGEANDDILVSTYSKSGTTWMQMILYQLTTSGDMNFDHLFDVSPWIYYAALREVEFARTPRPRIIKSHDDYSRFSGGRRGRFVFVIRDGRDVCLSLFHHRYNFKRFEGSFEEHFDDFINGTEYNWFDHIGRWLENANNLPITYIRFEDLKRDLAGTVLTIARECGITPDTETMERVIERCSFQHMKQHEARFSPRNEHFIGKSGSPYFVRHPDQFIRHGNVGEGVAALTPEQLKRYRQRFDQSLAQFPLVANYR